VAAPAHFVDDLLNEGETGGGRGPSGRGFRMGRVAPNTFTRSRTGHQFHSSGAPSRVDISLDRSEDPSKGVRP
jgi:hypothetical protein